LGQQKVDCCYSPDSRLWRKGRNPVAKCLIEKTLCEINYELANRPDWVPIPIDGLLSILNDEQVPSFRSVKPTEAEIT
jgi:predicted trehalose synthase